MRRRLSQCLLLATLLGAGLTACSNKTPDEKFAEAISLAQEGQTARAVLRMKEIVHDHPDDPVAADASMELARYYMSERNAPRALELLKTVSEKLGPNHDRGREAGMMRLEIMTRMGQFDQVLPALDEISKQLGESDPPMSRSIIIRKAQTLVMWGESNPEQAAKVDEGLKILSDMMLGEPRDDMAERAREELANYYRTRERFEESNTVYQQFLDKYPDTTMREHLLMGQAINLKMAGKTAEADEKFSAPSAALMAKAEAELDKEARGRMMLDIANYNALMGRYDEAEILMKRVMGENPMSQLAIQTQFAIASMYMQGQQFDKAREVLDQIKRENPSSNISQSADQTLQVLNNMQDAMTSAADRATSGTVELKGS